MDFRDNYDETVTDAGETIFIHKYINYKEELFDTNNMPSAPVEPNEFVSKVSYYLQKLGNIISSDTPKQIEAFCRLYNYNIELNSKGSNLQFIHAAQTGIGKSLSLQIYISMLQQQSSLVIVSKVDEAISYCKFINELRRDENYARCFYSITDKNKKNEYRVENYELSSYQCIVISHAMFQRLNQTNSIELYNQYNKVQRDLIVIDEKVNLYTKNIISLTELVEFKKMVSDLITKMGKENFTTKMLDNLLKEVTSFGKILKVDKEEGIFENGENIDLLVMGYPYIDYYENEKENEDFYLNNCNDELNRINELIVEKIEQIMDEIALLSKITSAKFKYSIKQDIDELLGRIENILTTPSESIFIYLDNLDVHAFCVDSIINKLGSCIVLDATARINEFYKIACYTNPNMKNTTVSLCRKYSNLTIFKAKGYRQGRSSIYKSISKEEKQYNAKMYLSHAANILSNKDDKLLIITHKDFKKSILDECNDPRIQFTHWGNHIGKNDWSDCNKVMVIGWNFISGLETLCTGINAINNITYAQGYISKTMIYELKKTQIVDDLIQGTMRTQARKIATKDGDCKPTEVYLYYEDTKEYIDVLDLFESQFPESKVVEWTPIGITPLVKRTKPNKNVDLIIAYLEAKESEHAIDVMLKDVLSDLGINKSTGSRLVNDNEYFKTELEKKGYILKNSDGKSKYFILK